MVFLPIAQAMWLMIIGKTMTQLPPLTPRVPSQEWLEIDGGVISALFNKANRR